MPGGDGDDIAEGSGAVFRTHGAPAGMEAAPEPMADEMQNRDPFEVAVARDMEAHCLLPDGVGVGVAVSGGADSVALLRVLCALAPDFGWRLTVLHVNHGLRGAESDDEEAFVRGLATAARLPLCVHRIEAGQAPSQGVEEWAREQRRAFYAFARRQATLARIATGHHRGDQAETVLFRLLRGAGSRGLGGMAALTAEGVARPLLQRSREEIRAYLRRLGQPWKEDSSNQDPTFRRNRLRGEWLPALAASHNPSLECVLVNTATQLRDAWRYLRQVAATEVDRGFQTGPYGWEGCAHRFAGLDVAIQREVILELTGRAAGAASAAGDGDAPAPALGFAAVETVRGLWLPSTQGGRFQVRGLVFQRSGRWLRVAPTPTTGLAAATNRLPLSIAAPKQGQALFAPPAVRFALPVGGAETGVDRGDWRSHIPRCQEFDSEYTGDWSVVDPRQLHFPLLLRYWREGDQFQLRGSGSKRKIKELFQRMAIPVWRRADEVVLESAGEIVWTASFGVAQGFAAATEEAGGCAFS
jgi:tRNA(Ile)-lysidine synthase